MNTWEIHNSCKKGSRIEFRSNDVFHKHNGVSAAQIIEADLIRIKYELFTIEQGKYLSQGEFDTSTELFTKMLKGE